VEDGMELENRYIVLKRSDIEKYIYDDEKITLSVICEKINDGRGDNGKAPIDALVIESDWPEYGNALESLAERVDS
jgi:hypothetical protein